MHICKYWWYYRSDYRGGPDSQWKGYYGSVTLTCSSLSDALWASCLGSIDILLSDGQVVGVKVWYSADGFQRNIEQI